MDPITTISEYFDIPYQWAQVYFVLLQNPPGPIGGFYHQTNFTRQKVYNILDNLVKNKFVTLIESSNKGNIYQATPIDDMSNIYLHDLELRLDTKSREKKQFIESVIKTIKQETNDTSDKSKLNLELISGDNTAHIVTDLIDETLHTFKIALSEAGWGLMAQIQPAVMRAFQRNSISVSLLFSEKLFAPDMSQKLFNSSFFPKAQVQEWIKTKRLLIRIVPASFQNFLLFDNINAILLFPNQNSINFSLKATVDNLSRYFLSQFEELWNKGKSVF